MLFHGSSDDLEAGKAQEQLFLARMLEADGGLGIVTHTFHPQYLAAAEAFVLDQLPSLQAFPTRRSRSAPRRASTRFSLRGMVEAMSGSRENFRSPAGDEADVPYWGREAERNRSSDERRKRSAPSSTRRPNKAFCGRLR